jgi:isoquinoline 1-oxidoreductase beta subunit
MTAVSKHPARRTFLKQSAALSGAFVLGLQAATSGTAIAAETSGAPEVTHWIVIQPDDTVIIRIARSELGQGSFTGLAQLVAEELECDWNKVKPEYADVNMHMRRNRIFKDMSTGGSRGIRDSHEYVRQGGAAAREMLIAAAAQQWNVPASECSASKGVVTHPSGKTARYGELAGLAATLPVPTAPRLKDPKNWKLIGTSPARFDIPAKVNGSQVYAADIRLPGMLHASILQSPVFGGFLKRYDDAAAKKMPGVKHIVTSEEWIAVVADNWWQANQALKAIKPEWENGEKGKISSASIMAYMREGLEAKEAPIARKDGDARSALAGAHKVLEAEYTTGFVNHCTMEPQTATAIYTAEKLDVWVGTQNGEASAAAASEAGGLPLDKVYIHKMHAGGGFGRRGPHQDYVKQAVKIAKAIPGTPVRLQWSREEDMRQGRYRPVTLVKLRGGLDEKGNWVGWEVRQSDQSIAVTVYPQFVKDGVDQINTRVFRDNPYAVPNFTNEYMMRDLHVPPGFWRAVAHTNNPFYRECFIDELAHAAGKDPYQFRRPLLEGKKDQAVLDAVAKAIGWDKPATKGVHRGIAVVDSYGSFTAAAVELSVSKGSVIDVKRVAVAIDSGHVVHPDAVKAQIEGGVVWGLSALMFEDITIEQGRVVQGNFGDYPLARIGHSPEVIPVLVPTGTFWGGVGEPPIGGVIPAMMNALFKATGKRIRSLPLRHHGFKYKA